MDIRKVKKLIEMLEESEVDEIEIHEGEESVRISRHRVPAGPPSGGLQAPEGHRAREYRAGEHGAREHGEISGGESSPAPEPVEEVEPEENIVRAPMVGIFYESPSQGKPPFVELGQTVKKGDVLCIIEAMKIMNQVEAEISGAVSKIMAENGEPVEYGQPLFVIRET